MKVTLFGQAQRKLMSLAEQATLSSPSYVDVVFRGSNNLRSVAT
jgi:hypothetical protein